MAQTNLIGKTILGYKVEENLGSGVFGTVYKVEKTNAAGQYIRALKHITIPTEKQYNSVLNSMGGDTSKADSYFSQMLDSIISEIQILNDLSEKGVQHIVRYYENDIQVTESPRRYDIYILMEYLTPLEDYIQSSHFTVRDVVKLGLDVLNGLKSCHNNGVIHRDIKDDNIFVSDKAEYKIGDFGVSKVLKDSSKAESLKGTPNFLAPEVYFGKESYTKSVDLYSLGIVLYRLLNYSRNPFLTHFPKQYFSQDEDAAFEERMSGKTPDIPSLGGSQIGQVIVKSISDGTNRFQTATEFIVALEQAIGNTSADILDEQVNIVSVNSISSPIKKEYGTTFRETAPSTSSDEDTKDEESNLLNRHLFESIGEHPPIEVQEIDSAENNQGEVNTPPITTGRVASTVPPLVNESPEAAALDKKVLNKFVFATPAIILLVGAIAYFIVVPKIYGQIVSLIDWLFTDSQNIVNTLRDPNIVLHQVNRIIGLKIFWWVWLSALIASLFFVGQQLQTKPETTGINALLTKREPYIMMLDVSHTLNQVKMSKNSKHLDAVIYAVKVVEEKLSVESDFGYGSDAIISCENNIAKQIQFLIETAQNLESGDFDAILNLINTAVMNINSLLRKRTELKKR